MGLGASSKFSRRLRLSETVTKIPKTGCFYVKDRELSLKVKHLYKQIKEDILTPRYGG
jgi:hypothetical protein